MLTTNKGSAGPLVVRHTRMASRLGELTVVGRGDTMIGLYFPSRWYRPDPARFGPCSNIGFEAVRDQISQYLAGDRQEFTVPVATDGVEYQGPHRSVGPGVYLA